MNKEQETLPFEVFEEEMVNPLKGVELSDIELFVASLLLDARSEKPIKMAEVIEAAVTQRDTQITSRQVRTIVHALRNDHGFPICSRKGSPAGYWWGRSESELEEFSRVFFSQISDEIRTVQKMLKTNYPRLAGQLRLDLGLEE